MKRLGLIGGLIFALAGAAQAQELRSDSPLWTYRFERDADLYPEAFFDAGSFGCAIPMRLGVYRRVPKDDEAEESFVRIDNYGVFHCALIYGEASDHEDAAEAFEDHAWLVVLGQTPRAGSGEDELIALQIGVRHGSRYALFRRPANNTTAPLEELDWRCPRTAERRTAHLDIWVQDACVISSKAELRGIARAAARRPILSTLEPPPRPTPPAD
ncbi:hypothetical protein BH09PSE1_BH09PSE1_25500 [soil metagenome]